MQVSGLPIRNNDQHAAEVASMSIHLLSEVQNFSIKHRSTEKLKLRIGIHSGKNCIINMNIISTDAEIKS